MSISNTFFLHISEQDLELSLTVTTPSLANRSDGALSGFSVLSTSSNFVADSPDSARTIHYPSSDGRVTDEERVIESEYRQTSTPNGGSKARRKLSFGDAKSSEE